MNGLFLSDLHLFSQRSVGQWHWEQHQELVTLAKVIVLGADIYFGHTHVPMSDFQFDRFSFHNSGSGLRDLRFAPAKFKVSLDHA